MKTISITTQRRHHSENDGASNIIVVQLYLGAQAVLVPLISGEAIRYEQLALPQYANTLLSCVRYQIPRPHNVWYKGKIRDLDRTTRFMRGR